MSTRTSQVNEALGYVRNGREGKAFADLPSAMVSWAGDTLATEVGRLEACVNVLEAALDAAAPPVLENGKPIMDSFGTVLRRDFRFSTEQAEKRVKELEEQIRIMTSPPHEMAERVEWKPECRSFYVYGPVFGTLMGSDHPVSAVVESIKLRFRVKQLEAENARLRESNDLLRKEHLEDPRGCHRPEEVRVATSVELSNGSKVTGFAAPDSISIVCDYMGKRTQIAWSNEAAIAVATIILGLHGKLADGAAVGGSPT